MLMVVRRVNRAARGGQQAAIALAIAAFDVDCVQSPDRVLFGRFSSMAPRLAPDGGQAVALEHRLEVVARTTFRDDVRYTRKDAFPQGGPRERCRLLMGGILVIATDEGQVDAVEIRSQVVFGGPGRDGAAHAGDGVSAKFRDSITTGAATSMGGSPFVPARTSLTAKTLIHKQKLVQHARSSYDASALCLPYPEGDDVLIQSGATGNRQLVAGGPIVPMNERDLIGETVVCKRAFHLDAVDHPATGPIITPEFGLCRSRVQFWQRDDAVAGVDIEVWDRAGCVTKQDGEYAMYVWNVDRSPVAMSAERDTHRAMIERDALALSKEGGETVRHKWAVVNAGEALREDETQEEVEKWSRDLFAGLVRAGEESQAQWRKRIAAQGLTVAPITLALAGYRFIDIKKIRPQDIAGIELRVREMCIENGTKGGIKGGIKSQLKARAEIKRCNLDVSPATLYLAGYRLIDFKEIRPEDIAGIELRVREERKKNRREAVVKAAAKGGAAIKDIRARRKKRKHLNSDSDA